MKKIILISFLVFSILYLTACTEGETVIESAGGGSVAPTFNSKVETSVSISAPGDPLNVLGECDKRISSLVYSIDNSTWQNVSSMTDISTSDDDCSDGTFTIAAPTGIATLLGLAVDGDVGTIYVRGTTFAGTTDIAKLLVKIDSSAGGSPVLAAPTNCGSPVYEGDGDKGTFESVNSTCASVVSDSIGDTHTWSFGSGHTCGGWLSINATTGALTGSPSESDQGPCNLVFRATDQTALFGESSAATVIVDNFCQDSPQSTWTQFDDNGDGSGGAPYMICTARQFLDIAANACGETLSGGCASNYILRGDIDFSGEASPHDPVGGNHATNINNFTGDFDGRGYSIKNFDNQSVNNNNGVFRISSGTIRNLKLESLTISGTDNVGGLLGANLSSGLVYNSEFVSGSVTGTSNATGGIVGINSGTIDESGSGASSSIQGVYEVGGIAGKNTNDIQECYSLGTLSGQYQVGGISGQIYATATITDSYVTATINSNNATGDQHFGGITGYIHNSTLQSNIFDGEINSQGSNYVGGIVGYLNSNTQGFTLQQNAARGKIDGNGSGVGGLIGYFHRDQTHVRNISGNYSATEIVTGGGAFTGSNGGGFVGIVVNGGSYSAASDLYSSNYWNTDTFISGQGSGPSLVMATELDGLSQAQMLDDSNFSGWNFTTVWDNDGDTNFPFLRSIPYHPAAP